MREELLHQMKDEVISKKEEVARFNKTVERIIELEQDPAVIEYINLSKSIGGTPRNILFDEVNVVRGIYNRLSYQLDESESNKIFVCLGTYHSHDGNSDVYKVGDDLVDFNSPFADYRLYKDLETSSCQCVPIKECYNFEKNNLGNIIYPNQYTAMGDYSKIQDDFLVEMVRNDQEYAKKYILSKYSCLKK